MYLSTVCTGLWVYDIQPEAIVLLFAYFFVALSAVSIFLKSLRASKIRITSIPFLIESSINFSTTSS